MIKCTTCSGEIPAGSAFCPFCGTRTPDSAAISAPTIRVGPGPDEPTPSRNITAPLDQTTLESHPLDQPSSSFGLPGSPASYAPPSSLSIPPTPSAYGAGTIPPIAPTIELNGYALIALIMGISGWVFAPLGVVAIICGHIARRQIPRAEGRQRGMGVALAGLIMGYIQVVLMVLLCIGFIVLVAIGSNYKDF